MRCRNCGAELPARYGARDHHDKDQECIEELLLVILQLRRGFCWCDPDTIGSPQLHGQHEPQCERVRHIFNLT